MGGWGVKIWGGISKVLQKKVTLYLFKLISKKIETKT
jgi:hypothetical protein